MARMPGVKTKDIVYIALFAALMAAFAVIPTFNLAPGIPITAQNMAVMLAGAVLGSKRGALAVLLCLVLVAAGLPLLSGGHGGIGVFAGLTAGFLVGWPISAFAIGWLVERFWRRMNFWVALACILIPSLLIVYPIGYAWFSHVQKVGYVTALLGSVVFLPGDILKAVLSAVVAVTVKRSYPIIQPQPLSVV